MASIQFRNRNASKTKKVSRLTLILRYKTNDEWNLLSILSKIEVPNILDKKHYPLEIKREVEDLKIHILSELKKELRLALSLPKSGCKVHMTNSIILMELKKAYLPIGLT